MKNNNLEKINYINKYARRATPPPGSTPPPAAPAQSPKANKTAPPGDTAASASPASPGAQGVQAIKNMQKAIIDFAKTVTSYTFDTKNKQLIAENDPTKDFNDFMAEQYSAGSSIKGEEWDPSLSATSGGSKRPTDIIELNNIINNLYRMGRSEKELEPDGNWDFRTQNAVKNVWALADALVRLTEDFDRAPDIFTRDDLSSLRAQIPITNSSVPARVSEELSKILDKGAKAAVITPLVDKLSKAYISYKRFILTNPAYKSYINKDQPLFNVTKADSDPGTIPKEHQNKDLSKLFLYDVVLPTGGEKKSNTPYTITISKIALSDFTDVKSLMSLMSNKLSYTNEQITDKNLQQKVIAALLGHIEKKPLILATD